MQHSVHQRCIDACLHCFQVCAREAMVHCLDAGGKHTEPAHFRTMLACAEMCRTTATIMLMQVENHDPVCTACEQLCLQCAKSCDGIPEMRECAAHCRSCADACHEAGKLASFIPA